MRITQLDCTGFRCLDGFSFKPRPGLNVLRGANAQGKTTVLEAALFATTARSHRTGVERDLVRHDADQFHLRLQGERENGPADIAVHWWQGAKRVRVNGVAQSRVSDLLGRFNVVLFCPEDAALVRESASARRRFLDMEISQISPACLNALQQYRQALRQRNELLRSPRPEADLIAVWDEQLVRHGGVIMDRRGTFIERLAVHARAAHARIASGEELEIRYRPDVRPDDSFAEALERSRASDIRRGATGRGPHRDDMEILIGGHAARTSGSQGQQKTAALALRLAELELVREECGEYPVLMLDEVLAELDADRRSHLLAAIDDAVQCILTTTTLGTGGDGLGGSAGSRAAEFRIGGGQLEEI
jgi:DNA replication and repair protein RecF